MIELEYENNVAIVRLAHGKANAMDTKFMLELTDAVDQVERSGAGAMVLTAEGNVFSAGVDLFQVLNGGRAYLAEFLPRMSEGFRALFAFSKPAVAAINGHAIAGGMILACACDYRVLAEGARIGIPELRVGVPFPLTALEIVRYALRPDLAQEAILFGKVLEARAALAAGYVHDVTTPECVLERAVARASELAAAPGHSFAKTKRDLRQPTLERLDRDQKTSDKNLIDDWASPTVQNAIRSYVEKTIKK